MGPLTTIGLATALAAAAAMPSTWAQASSALPSGCISLRGSTQCPAFQDAYVNPQNLSRAWPWMAQVTDVASFDQQFAQYWTDPNRFMLSKINKGLQCNATGAANVTLQYERTVYCGQFTQFSYSAQCNVNVQPPITVCQNTCSDYAASQSAIVANPQVCAPSSGLSTANNNTRSRTLAKDLADCTNSSSIFSNDANCVKGDDNEGNCGYGPSVNAQLCAACDPSGNKTVASCCTSTKTTLTACASFGHPGAARLQAVATSSSSSGVPASSSTGGAVATAGNASSMSSENANGPDLSSGQLAGILVGSIVGALLLGALIAWLLFGKRRRERDANATHGAVYGSMAGRASSGDKPWNSEDHMSRRSMAGSPEVEKSGAGGSHAINMMTLGAGAAGVGAAGAAAAGHHRAEDNTGSPVNRPTSAALTSSSGGEKGATVAVVRDQYTGQDIHVGEEVVAIYPYNASLNDELTLEPEQRITILRLYDDGWALGRAANGAEGALPLVCISSTKGDVPGRRGGNGTSTGTGTSDDEGLTSGNEYTSSVDGAVTAEEGGFTSDARSQRSRR